MDIGRAWRALTTGERSILVTSSVLLVLLLIGGAVLLGITPFQAAQTDPAGGSIVDTDGDGLSDDNEALLFGTDPQATDTDADGMPDGWEAEHTRTDPSTGLPTPDPARADPNADPDGDELGNLAEFQNGTDPWTRDSDGDGLPDGWEVQSEHDPLSSGTPGQDEDGDGLTAEQEFAQATLDNAIDTDEDGLTDAEEPQGAATVGGRSFSFTPTDPARRSSGGSGLADGFAVVHDLDPHGPNVGRIDHDDDGLSTALEAQISLDRFDDTRTALLEGLDPQDRDSDGDSLPDGWESTHDLDPLDPADGNQDPDGDGLTNGREFFWRTDPLETDTDGDGLSDGQEIDGYTITVDGRDQQATSNPLLADSDNDGLGDLAERNGVATVNGTDVEFAPTHALLPDTDGDGLEDAEEVERVFGDDEDRLDPTRADTDGDGLLDGEELTYWNEREAAAENDFPSSLSAPEGGDCRAEAAGAIQSQRPSVVGPAGDPDGDCIPNILDADSDRPGDASLPAGTKPLLDGQEVDPPDRNRRQLPGSDPAAADTDGDGLPDEWEIRWARYGEDVDGSPTWLFDPTDANSDGDQTPGGDAILDGQDDDEGERTTPGSSLCWQDVVYGEDPAREATGDGVPWLARSYANVDEMQRDTDPLGRRGCDSDEDGLNDGWEAAYTGPNLDPKRAIEDRWTGAVVQTACYPGSISQAPTLPSLDEVGVEPVRLDQVPPSGALSAPLDESLLPSEDPRGQIAWRAQQTGCSWDGASASFGSQCPDCTVIGVVATLDLQQWYKTNPRAEDTDGDGAPDAWEILWHAVAGQRRDLIDPSSPSRDADGDGAAVREEFTEGASPLTADTDGDGENDGPDEDPLAVGQGEIALRDADRDHLLDDTCQSGDVPGAFEPTDPQRAQALRDLKIVEPDPGVFLCEPRSDPSGTSIDSDGEGTPDVIEILYTYRDPDRSPRTLDNGRTHDPDGDGIPTISEPHLGRPAGWPDTTIWWFGANPLSANGYDADGDGLAEGLLLDPDPFDTLPQQPTPSNAWSLACDVGLVCPSQDPFAWSGSTSQSSLDVTLEDVGHSRGSDRVVAKDGTNLPATVTVTDGSTPVAEMPVALIALDRDEASQLGAGDKSVLAQPERALCIVTTGSDGTASTSDCDVESSETSADLTGTGRSWLGTTSPAWTRDLSVLDPTVSDSRVSSPENQDRIVAWAMGSGTNLGATAEQPVLVNTTVELGFEALPEDAASGEEITVTARAVDGAGDPLQAGTLTLTSGDEELTADVTGDPTVEFSGVQMPNITTATDHELTLTYTSQDPAHFVKPPTDPTTSTVRVLPVPTVVIDPPERAAANETVDIGLHVQAPGGDPVQGPVTVALGDANATGTTDANGRANLSLAIPADVQPGTPTLVASFEGNDAYGPASAQQNLPVKQKLVPTVTPDRLRLGADTAFTVSLVDLAGRAPLLDVNVTLSLGNQTASTTVPANEDLATAAFPVTGALGDTGLGLSAHTTRDRRYVPLDTQVPVTIRSPGFIDLPTDRVARGEAVNLTVNVTDSLGRPVPTAELNASWSHGQANVTIEDGVGTIPFETPPTAEPEPVTLTLTLEGTGLLPTQRTKQIRLQVGTDLSASVEVDPLAGLVTVPFTLTDDQGAPIAGAPVNVSWPLGEPVTVRTDAEGRGEATLVIPDDASPGDVPVRIGYEGDATRQPSETFKTVPVRAATHFDVPDEIIWSEGKQLSVVGTVLSAEDNASVAVPVKAIHGGDVVAATDGEVTPFRLAMDADEVQAFAGDARQFTLKLTTNGTERWAPAETTVLVQRLVPVEIATGINRTGDRVTVHVKATTPQGPLAKAPITIGQENGPPVKVETDTDGEASVRLSDASGTLIARYSGDEQHAPANAQINLQEPAAPTAANYGWLIFIAVAALIAVDAWIIYRVIQRMRVGRQVEKVLSDLEEQLVLGDEVQAAIYHAYLRLKATAEVLGQPEQETETVREFGRRFVDGLDLRSDPVMGLIGIFEQAWYGEVDPSMRTEAIEELRRLQDHLEDRGLVA